MLGHTTHKAVLSEAAMTNGTEKNSIPTDSPESLRRFASWVFVICSCLLTLAIAFAVVWIGIKSPNYFIVSVRHFPVVVGLPLAGVAALFIVIVCKIVSGEKLSFSVFGFKFEGASGPVVLWVLCFLAITLAIFMLWDKTSGDEIKLRPDTSAMPGLKP
jgi:hypothetical protein